MCFQFDFLICHAVPTGCHMEDNLVHLLCECKAVVSECQCKTVLFSAALFLNVERHTSEGGCEPVGLLVSQFLVGVNCWCVSAFVPSVRHFLNGY
jgi:hypothetical protein